MIMQKRGIMDTGIVLTQSGNAVTESFAALIARLNRRIPAAEVEVFGVEESLLATQLSQLAAAGFSRVIIIPLAVCDGAGVLERVTLVVEDFAVVNPAVSVELLPDYTSLSVIEDALWESMAARTTDCELLPELGADIETLSHRIIDTKLEGYARMNTGEKIVARRIIHSTADYSFADTLRFSEKAVASGIAALRAGKPIICDVNMLKTAMTKVGSEVICRIAELEVAVLARKNGCTRAAASMISLEEQLDGAVVVIGNAPTAIWQLLKMAVRPALVVGLPVGFVGARESKLALIASDHEYIANTTAKGGSPAAAAALNALALLAREG